MYAHTNVLDYLEASSAVSPQVLAVMEGDRVLMYEELKEQSRRIGSSLAGRGDAMGHAIVVAIEKGCIALSAMLGVLYVGVYYVPVNPSLPEERLACILDVLGHPLVVVDASSEAAPLLEMWYDNVVDVGGRVTCDIDRCLIETGDVYYRGRRDAQVKYMGHRIELGDIDAAAEPIPGVWRCRCAYDRRHARLCAFFEGEAQETEVRRRLAQGLPAYMRPTVVARVNAMPLNKNGKVDRAQLLAMSVAR